MGTGLGEYAPRILSTPGTRNGLYWPTRPDEADSLLGPLVARARAEGYRRTPPDQPTMYQGYDYRILTRQGAHASGWGTRLRRRRPSPWRVRAGGVPRQVHNSGIMTFLVDQTGIVYQKNLGPDTARIATQMTEFDPDLTWTTP